MPAKTPEDVALAQGSTKASNPFLERLQTPRQFNTLEKAIDFALELGGSVAEVSVVIAPFFVSMNIPLQLHPIAKAVVGVVKATWMVCFIALFLRMFNSS